MLALFLAAAMTGQALDVEVEAMDGRRWNGTLQSVTSEEIIVATTQDTEALASRDLLSVRFMGDAYAEPARGIQIQLRDGSQLRAIELTAERGRATMQCGDNVLVRASTNAIREVLFKQQDSALRQQWHEIVARGASADVIVIRKTSQTTDDNGNARIEVALDHLEGVLGDITETHIGFLFDNTQVQVTREKVEGLIYYRPPASSTPRLVCQVTMRDGSRWNARAVKLEDNELQVTTPAGVRLELPIANITRLDYGAANLTFLADLEPESVSWRPHIRSAATPPSVARWFQPRRSDEPLVLRGLSYEQNLVLHSRTELTYRLQQDYQRLRATVGIDDRFRSEGNVRLVITANQRLLFDQEVSGRDPALELDLDLAGARRLTILVDFGADQTDWGDHVNFCNARLIK